MFKKIIFFTVLTALSYMMTLSYAENATHRIPQVEVNPAMIVSRETAEYEIKITNLDDMGCNPVTFTISPWYSKKFLIEYVTTANITLAPREKESLFVHMTAVWELEDGIYTLPFYIFSSAIPEPGENTFYFIQYTPSNN